MSAPTTNSNKKKLALFASGTGSNTIAITEFMKDKAAVEVVLIASNNPSAPILRRPEVAGIPKFVFNRSQFSDQQYMLGKLDEFQVEFIALAGFLWLLPSWLVTGFEGRIVNIHPALLPKYGGKGMYGSHVHTAVFESGDPESGITIHEVNQRYDEGKLIFQARCNIADAKSPDEIGTTVLALEHYYYPRILFQWLQSRNSR